MLVTYPGINKSPHLNCILHYMSIMCLQVAVQKWNSQVSACLLLTLPTFPYINIYILDVLVKSIFNISISYPAQTPCLAVYILFIDASVLQFTVINAEVLTKIFDKNITDNKRWLILRIVRQHTSGRHIEKTRWRLALQCNGWCIMHISYVL